MILWISFVHSFIQALSIAPLQVHYYSEVLPRRHADTVSVFHAEAPLSTPSEGLAQGPAWRLDRDSNPRPVRRKALNQPMSHPAPQFLTTLQLQLSLFAITELCSPLEKGFKSQKCWMMMSLWGVSGLFCLFQSGIWKDLHNWRREPSDTDGRGTGSNTQSCEADLRCNTGDISIPNRCQWNLK